MPSVGKASSTAVASTIRTSFEGIEVGLVVGICGGVPITADGAEILQGDVIVSEIMIQIDFGGRYPDKFIRKDTPEDNLGRANPEIRSFLGEVSGQRVLRRLKDKTASYSAELCKKQRMARICGRHCSSLYEGFFGGLEECRKAVKEVDFTSKLGRIPNEDLL